MLFEGASFSLYSIYCTEEKEERKEKKNRSSKILCIMSHTAPSLLPWVFITKTLKFLQISTKKNTKHYKAVSNYFFFVSFLFVCLFICCNLRSRYSAVDPWGSQARLHCCLHSAGGAASFCKRPQEQRAQVSQRHKLLPNTHKHTPNWQNIKKRTSIQRHEDSRFKA